MAKFKANYDPVRNSEVCREWRKQNKEYKAACDKRYVRENRDKVRLIGIAYKAKRRTRITKAGGFFTSNDINHIRQLQNDQCAFLWCREALHGKGHRDHIIPVSRSGTSWPENIQLLCPKCNLDKKAKTSEEYAASVGYMLEAGVKRTEQ